MNAMPVEPRWALAALRDAARVTRVVQQRLGTRAVTKADRSPVTAADFAAQAVVSAWLMTYDPDTPLLAEEDLATWRTIPNEVRAWVLQAVHLVRPKARWDDVEAWLAHNRGVAHARMWVLDPVDGTKGFLRGAHYAVALALIDQGRIQWAGLACPRLAPEALLGESDPARVSDMGVLAVAAPGVGAWWSPLISEENWRRLRVSSVANPAQARVLRSFEAAHTHEEQIDALMHVLGVHRPPVRLDSQAKYALLAAGAAEIYLRIPPPQRPDYKEKIWDQAAGALLVIEAGGRVTDLDGRALDFSQGLTLARNRGVLATNGLLHEPVLMALRRVVG
ncbi:MAG: 3'(2'),5'-bisphosphate nucleotidase [Chloroflexi bacterium]|nr:3'(2'),5'-bisphosphate nucleotidase [Chloroflexota bacterium]